MRWWIVGFAVAAIIALAMAASGEQQVIVMENGGEGGGALTLGASLAWPDGIRPDVGDSFMVAYTAWRASGEFPAFGATSVRTVGCDASGFATSSVTGSQRSSFLLEMTAEFCSFSVNFTICDVGCLMITEVAVLAGGVQGPGDNVVLSGSVSEATLADQIPFLVFGGLFLWGLLNGWLVVAYIGTLGVLLTQIDSPLPYGEPYVVLLALVLLWVVFLGRRFRPIREGLRE